MAKAALIDTGPITVKGTFTSPTGIHGRQEVRGSAIGATMGFCYAAQVVECSVDEVTGKVTAHKVWVAVDVGRALNPLAVEGQIQGGVWMGMGQALSEETRFDDGRMMHANLLDYRVPTIVEARTSRFSSSRVSTPTGRSAPRKPAKACWPASCRR